MTLRSPVLTIWNHFKHTIEKNQDWDASAEPAPAAPTPPLPITTTATLASSNTSPARDSNVHPAAYDNLYTSENKQIYTPQCSASRTADTFPIRCRNDDPECERRADGPSAAERGEAELCNKPALFERMHSSPRPEQAVLPIARPLASSTLRSRSPPQAQIRHPDLDASGFLDLMNHAATPTPTARSGIIHVDSPATRPGASFDSTMPRAPDYRLDFTSSPRANILSPSRSRDAEPNKCLPRGAPNPNKPRLNFHVFTFKFTFQVEFKLRVQVQAFKLALKAKVEGAEPEDDEPEALRAEEKRFTHPFPGALNENQADLEAV
ncbi:hypothetical protein DFH09DRAFT_1373042 [Mycena vulgaris]|nr:hypothetical protein DFH09DRAFT_1373042 [Mycena vulgaris]